MIQMLLGAEIVNDNGISSVALAFFTALLAAVTSIIIGVYQIKAKANEAKDAAVSAKEETQKTVENTASVANGFTGRVDRKLDTLIASQADLSKALRDHLEWHLDNPSQRG